jgi:MFS family permease
LKHNPYLALKNKSFVKFITGKFCLTVAMQIQAVVVSWQIYQITKDPLSLGIIGLVEAIPSLSVALFAGYLTDHYSRKKIVQNTCLLILATSLGLWFMSLGLIPVTLVTTLPYYILLFLNGVARGFLSPSAFAWLGDMLSQEEMLNASMWSSSSWQLGSIMGPALAGLIYVGFGTSLAYGLQVMLVIACLAFYFSIKVDKPVSKKSELKFVAQIYEGITFVFQRPVILGALSLDLFAVLFGGAVALLPVFAADILKVGPEGLGYLRAAPAFGSALMAIILVYAPPLKYLGKWLLVGVFAFGLSMLGFALSTDYYLSFFFLAASGAFDNISVVVRGTIIQTHTPAHMKGRVSAVNSIFIGSSNELGALESGVAAKLMGTVPSVIFGSIMTLMVVATVATTNKPLRRLRT